MTALPTLEEAAPKQIDYLALASLIELRGPWKGGMGIQLTRMECALIVTALKAQANALLPQEGGKT